MLLQAERALTLGLLDQAERLYRQTIAADPRNSIAVVGLARVALERGDEAGALWHARRALVIDPDNPAARRLVDRMVEVITRRGDAVPDGGGLASGSATTPVAGSLRADEPPPQDDEPPPPVAGAPPPAVPVPPPTAKRGGLLRRLIGRG